MQARPPPGPPATISPVAGVDREPEGLEPGEPQASRGDAPEPPREPRAGQRWLSLAEALGMLLLCLIAALAVGGIELLLVAPSTQRIEFKLYERERAGVRAAAPQEVVQRIEALGLPGTVEWRERRDVPVIVVHTTDSLDAVAAAVNDVLMQAGYRPAEPDVHTMPDAEALLRDRPALTLGLQAVVLIGFGTVLARLRVRGPAPSAVASTPAALGLGAAAGLVGFSAALLVSGIQHLLGWSIQEQAWLLELLEDRRTVLTILPFVVLLMPMSEETLFRGYLFRFLLQRNGAATAYLVSAACFSAVHFHLPGLPTYFVVGLLFAYVCRRTSTLIAPMAGHVTYNGLALGLSLLVPGAGGP